MLVKIGKYNGNRNSGNIYTRVILTEIYHLSGMKSFRDDLIDRMKTGWGRFVLASFIWAPVYSCAHRLNMELDHQSSFGLLCTVVLKG
jgi:hypothetical protein